MTGSFKQNSCYILGVSGGSGSGKTYFAKDLKLALGDDCEILYQDNYYIDQSKNFDYDGGSVNFDHPSAIDFELLSSQLEDLKIAKNIEVPTYDFVSHSRKQETIIVKPKPIIIVDGILIFHPPKLRSLFDERVFFNTSENLRFERRLKRDVEERGREPEGVKNQFYKQVKPMHDEFVEPSSVYADRIVNDTSDYPTALKDYILKLSQLVRG